MGTTPLFAATNRLQGGSWAFDEAGHMTQDNVNRQYQWDAEGRVVFFDEVPLSNAKDRTYDYDAEGRRVRKAHPGGGSVTVTVTRDSVRPADSPLSNGC